MITVGGANTSHITDNCDMAIMGLRVLDMTDLSWGTAYDPDAGQYQVPAQVVKLIGGSYVSLRSCCIHSILMC